MESGSQSPLLLGTTPHEADARGLTGKGDRQGRAHGESYQQFEKVVANMSDLKSVNISEWVKTPKVVTRHAARV